MIQKHYISDSSKYYSNAYRFGFNGKEKDAETYGEGNEYDYGMRIYNPRNGRFFSVDPLFRKYPELTTYQFASNTPIQAIDLDGLEKFIVIGKETADGKINTVMIELPEAGKFGDGILKIFQKANGNIKMEFTGPSIVGKKPTIWDKIINIFKIPIGTGGTHWTAEFGLGEETRQGDGKNISDDIDFLLNAGSLSTKEAGAFKMLKVTGSVMNKLNSLAKNLKKVVDIYDCIENPIEGVAEKYNNIFNSDGTTEDTETTVPVYSGQEKKPDSIDHPVTNENGDTTGGFRAKYGENPLKGRPIKKSDIKIDK